MSQFTVARVLSRLTLPRTRPSSSRVPERFLVTWERSVIPTRHYVNSW